MTRNEQAQHVTEKLLEATSVCQSMGELADMLMAIGYTLGSLTCEFEKEHRAHMVMQICEMVGNGLMATSQSMGDSTDLEMVIGHREGQAQI
ncbi:hypothetical protein D3C71_1304570 [compost metagenome]